MSFYFNLPFLLEMYAHSVCAEEGGHISTLYYRPISLTSVLSVVFESILNRKIWKHLNSSNLISDRQYGFRKKRSTGDLLSLLSDSLSSTLRGFGESFAVALDISKAFDRVWHKALISKLPSEFILLSVTFSLISSLVVL